MATPDNVGLRHDLLESTMNSEQSSDMAHNGGSGRAGLTGDKSLTNDITTKQAAPFALEHRGPA